VHQTSAEAESGGAEPAKVEHVEGSEVSRLTLTPKAVQRLGIKTTPLSETTVAGKKRKVIPYGAVLYDAEGKTSVYVSPRAQHLRPRADHRRLHPGRPGGPGGRSRRWHRDRDRRRR
jgi:hypothetical protein